MGAEIAGLERGGGRIAEDRIHRWFVFSLFCLGRGYNYSTALIYPTLLSSIPHSHHSNPAVPFASPSSLSENSLGRCMVLRLCSISTNPFPFVAIRYTDVIFVLNYENPVPSLVTTTIDRAHKCKN